MNNQRYYTICYSRTAQDAKSIHTYLPLFLYALDFLHNSNMTFANFALHPRTVTSELMLCLMLRCLGSRSYKIGLNAFSHGFISSSLTLLS